MRVLAGWDDAAEAELLELYLNVDQTSATVLVGSAAMSEILQQEEFPFDVVLLSVFLKDRTETLGVAMQLKLLQPDCPVVVAVRPDEVRRLTGFLRIGIPTALPRDSNGDFLFLVHSTLEATLQGAQSAAERVAAEAMRAELKSLRALQTAVLTPQLTAPTGYRIAVRCDPLPVATGRGETVSIAGGDYYDAVHLATGQTTLILADATGHGLRASLSIVALDALLRTVPAARFQNPARLLGDLNRLFCRQRLNRIGGGFVTAVCLVLDQRTGRITWSSAGHPPPLLISPTVSGATMAINKNSEPEGTAERSALVEVSELALGSQPGPPLGVVEKADYPTGKLVLSPGGRLLLYTDGLSEARAPSQQVKQFGIERLKQVAALTHVSAPGDALDQIFAAVDQFAESLGRRDDATALIIERTGGE